MKRFFTRCRGTEVQCWCRGADAEVQVQMDEVQICRYGGC